jgi:hypothetical protein
VTWTKWLATKQHRSLFYLGGIAITCFSNNLPHSEIWNQNCNNGFKSLPIDFGGQLQFTPVSMSTYFRFYLLYHFRKIKNLANCDKPAIFTSFYLLKKTLLRFWKSLYIGPFGSIGSNHSTNLPHSCVAI